MQIERIHYDAQVIQDSVYFDGDVKEALLDGTAQAYKTVPENCQFIVIRGGHCGSDGTKKAVDEEVSGDGGRVEGQASGA